MKYWKLKKYYLVSLILLVFSINSFSQSIERKGIIYNSEKSVNFGVHNNGWFIGYNIGKIKTYYKTDFFSFNIGHIRHEKEIKLQRRIFSFTQTVYNGYRLGKRNNLFVARAMRGRKIYYSDKARYKGVSVGFSYSGGLTLGLLKPYYIKIIKDGQEQIIKYSEENESDFLNLIVEGQPFYKGFLESKPVPGINLQSAIHIDWGQFDFSVKAIEAGIMLDLFPKKMPIMINEQNSAVFLNLFLNLQFGIRK